MLLASSPRSSGRVEAEKIPREAHFFHSDLADTGLIFQLPVRPEFSHRSFGHGAATGPRVKALFSCSSCTLGLQVLPPA
jgi:hypothetical protein